MFGAAVKPTGGGGGDPAGRAAAAEGGGGSSGGGTGDSGRAEGCCGRRPGPVQGSLPAARRWGAPVSDPPPPSTAGVNRLEWTMQQLTVRFYCFELEGIRKSTASSNGSSWSWMMSWRASTTRCATARFSWTVWKRPMSSTPRFTSGTHTHTLTCTQTQ